MKLSTFVVLSTLSFTSLHGLAQDVVFKPMDDKFETHACVVAATSGINAVKSLLTEKQLSFREFEKNLSCNGKRIEQFAKTFANKPAKPVMPINVAFVPKNENVESKICVDAVLLGKDAALAKHNAVNDNIICNNKNIADFVEQFENRTVVARLASNSAE